MLKQNVSFSASLALSIFLFNTLTIQIFLTIAPASYIIYYLYMVYLVHMINTHLNEDLFKMCICISVCNCDICTLTDAVLYITLNWHKLVTKTSGQPIYRHDISADILADIWDFANIGIGRCVRGGTFILKALRAAHSAHTLPLVHCRP